jgi:hypothetical protein
MKHPEEELQQIVAEKLKKEKRKTKVRHVLDKGLDKLISRKLLVWLAATAIFAFTKSMSSGDWVVISAIYIGGQTVVDAIVAMKGSSKASKGAEAAMKAVLKPKKKDETGKKSTADNTGDTVTK